MLNKIQDTELRNKALWDYFVVLCKQYAGRDVRPADAFINTFGQYKHDALLISPEAWGNSAGLLHELCHMIVASAKDRKEPNLKLDFTFGRAKERTESREYQALLLQVCISSLIDDDLLPDEMQSFAKRFSSKNFTWAYNKKAKYTLYIIERVTTFFKKHDISCVWNMLSNEMLSTLK